MCEACNSNVVPLHSGKHRVKLKEVNSSLHCSIIGTCLSMAELRKIARKIDAEFDKGVRDYDIHSAFVNLIGSHDLTARLLNKLLDRKYATVISRVRSMRTEDELLAYWQTALETGDIPGPYWAVMSHFAATEHCRAVLFGDVHMLSHMVGAANRADINRLQTLESENQTLLKTQHDETNQYRNKIVERDLEISDLRDQVTRGKLSLAKYEGTERRLQQFESGSIVESMGAQIATLQTEMEKRAKMQERKEQALRKTSSELVALQEVNTGLMEEYNEVLQERRSMERILEQGLGELCGNCDLAGNASTGPSIDLDGTTILYVGGRTSQVHHMRTLVEQAGGAFVHHDGGIEDNDHRLTQLLSRGDIVMCPIDCVSHSACLRAKKFCQNKGKNFVPLRSSGLSSFVAGLEGIS
jgi:Uncharacterized protein conserved in bacteria (DUF2325)